MKSDQSGTLWTIDLFIPERGVQPVWHALAACSNAVAAFQVKGGSVWQVTAHCDAPPDRSAVTAAVSVGAVGVGLAPPEIIIREVPPTDWLAENRKSFAPVIAGRFFVCASTYDGRIPANLEIIRIDAGPAFGAGSHETTRGCLLALDGLARSQRVRDILDLGCGSGILAVAAAKTWRRPVTALDIDPVAVATASRNARANGVGDLVRARRGSIEAAQRLGLSFDLVVANILAGPLIDMAVELKSVLAPGGRLVLSGLLEDQEAAVLSIYRAQGLALGQRVVLGAWPTLVLRS